MGLALPSIPELTEAEALFKSAVLDTAEDFGLGVLFASYPFLNWWPLNSIIKWIIGNAETGAWGAITMLINVEYVVFKNSVTQTKFAAAQLSLKQIAQQSGLDSAAYAAQRIQNQKTFAAHVRSLLVPAL